jgi:ATP-dependent Lon protease
MNIFKKPVEKLQRPTIHELRQMILSANLPHHIKQIASSELETLSNVSADTATYKRELHYIDYLVNIPWNKKTKDNLDAHRTEDILNERLYGLREVKQRIIENLNVKIFMYSKKPRILVVDDEKLARKNLEHILKKENYNVVTATSGLEALNKLEVSEFDVVLTDLKMENVNGIEVLAKTKAKYPNTQVIIVTAYASVESAIEAIKRDAFYYIEKPFRLDEVRTVVKKALEKKHNPVSTKGSILCFSGPPGTGKTSLGRSIAEALGRKFARISLGGMKDEAEIRGDRRTYGGALPGCIIEEIRRTGTSNPVLMLDEIDKIGEAFKGDPVSALLEVLDPEQNKSFIDHYLEIPFDLSNVIFIVTATSADNIQDSLRDHMEVIEFSGYKENEKKIIALHHLVPKQIREQGLSDYPPEFTADAISKIINEYTREAGIGDLEQYIAYICREIAAEFIHYKKKVQTIEVTPELAQEYLEQRTYYLEETGEKNRIGIATGLIKNKGKGGIISIEAARMKGLINRFENLFTEVTFAEAGEFDTARVFLKKADRPQQVQRISNDIRIRSAPRISRA